MNNGDRPEDAQVRLYTPDMSSDRESREEEHSTIPWGRVLLFIVIAGFCIMILRRLFS